MLLEINKHFFDIKQAIQDIEEFTKNISFQYFKNEKIIQSAVERKFEIIGEALNRVKKLDEKILDRISDSHKIIGLRNVIIHGYDIIDEKIIWDAIQYNLPKLKIEIIALMDV